jgi:hypothetical protein
MRAITINTTAFHEEDLKILTNLSNSEIIAVLQPIIDGEREMGDYYDNYDLLRALIESYPGKIILELETEYLEL